MKLSTLVLLFVAVAMAVPAESPDPQRRRARSKKVSQLRDRLKNLREQKSRLQHKLHSNKVQTHQTLQDIARVDVQLGQVETALEETTQQLGQSKIKQKVVAVELNEATQQLDVVKAQVGQRLRRIYTGGQTSSLSILLGSRNAGEMASRADMLTLIANSDHRVFRQYKELQAKVADRKHVADDLVVRISNLAKRQEAEQETLHTVLKQKNDKVQELKQQQGELEEAISQFEEDEQQITSQINSFMAQLSREGNTLPAFSGGFIRPVPGRITSGFGWRYHPILHISRMHKGIDFAARTGTPIHAAAGGIIVAAQYMRGYGNVVTIAHSSSLSTVYAHMSRIYVRGGQRVRKGETIGAVGATGLATGPHLHFEVHVNGRAVNPIGRF
ncbi:MAG: hypothetical protein QOJ65_711 [Fimbriimonadaceae bacterium]|jgi:murein DD-endopeptidase MepM/ murein hydrolase activator NlpD|nr:hypothetical protein [Fimbriimonadaceae bacterium]